MSIEKRIFEFANSEEGNVLHCTLKSDADQRTIQLRFLLDNSTAEEGSSNDVAFNQGHSGFISNPKSKVAGQIIHHAKKPFVKWTTILSDLLQANTPLVTFSRPYLEKDSSIGIVDVTLDRTADFNKVLRAVVTQLVLNPANPKHEYTYKATTYGKISHAEKLRSQNEKPSEPAHQRTIGDIRESEMHQREDETADEFKARATKLRRSTYREVEDLNQVPFDIESKRFSSPAAADEKRPFGSSPASTAASRMLEECWSQDDREPQNAVPRKAIISSNGLNLDSDLQPPRIIADPSNSNAVDMLLNDTQKRYTGR